MTDSTTPTPTDELPGMLAVAKATSEQAWPNTMDAQKWAEEWLKSIAERPEIATDEGTMIAWFASAIMAGYDTASLRLSEAENRAARAEELADLYVCDLLRNEGGCDDDGRAQLDLDPEGIELDLAYAEARGLIQRTKAPNVFYFTAAGREAFQ